MLRLITIILLGVFLFGCKSTSEVSRESHVFFINGDNIEVSDDLLKKIRSRIDAQGVQIVTSALMDKKDVRWTLDYISLSELLYSQDCEHVQLLNTRKFDINRDIDENGTHIKAGSFDYVWEIKVCDILRYYRVVNELGDNSFTVYPLKL
ncbi:hypothetical protein J8M21_23645 [Pseudoalteromonas luteoviolacea]|uniref:hypothetical protein n=1 Tax=Pseudoalteromonas luteoviolacea TaxID=43657 RepID=UPI001B3A315B|nr:hypothetical protein [Pseudoalteromonas luteoviolacea]MBQ4880200.1 hypothetical protein [Pseudoalteromonas luteoviolacea]MBQ4909261.1 hypothetical protein [Pseudoalteromonas luteoviolacea]